MTILGAYARYYRSDRRNHLRLLKTDNVALSFFMICIQEMVVFSEQSPEKHGRRAAGVPHSTGNKDATARPGEDKRYVQKQFGLASAETTRKYQRRRDRFHVNLSTVSGL